MPNDSSFVVSTRARDSTMLTSDNHTPPHPLQKGAGRENEERPGKRTAPENPDNIQNRRRRRIIRENSATTASRYQTVAMAPRLL
eukprot:2240531-Pyramimonas_sp.AAC.2